MVAEGLFRGGQMPVQADLVWFTGPNFVRSDGSVLALVNTPSALEYAPSLSPDGRELYFTRLRSGRPPQIYLARRPETGQPFDEPSLVSAAAGFVEAPSLAPTGTMYYHKRVDHRFQLYRL